MFPGKSIILSSLVGGESRQIPWVDWVAQSGDKDPPVAPPTHSLHHNTTLRHHCRTLLGLQVLEARLHLSHLPVGVSRRRRCLLVRVNYCFVGNSICFQFLMKTPKSRLQCGEHWCSDVSTLFQGGCSSVGRHLQQLALVPLSHSGAMWKTDCRFK